MPWLMKYFKMVFIDLRVLILCSIVGSCCVFCGSEKTGGDLNIGFAGGHWTPRIDAHPSRSGDFQHGVVISSEEVFLTRDGLKEYNKINSTGYQAYIFEDTRGGFFSTPTPGQYFTGRP